MANIDALFKTMLDEDASDLHLVSGEKPTLRIHGELERMQSHNVLDDDELRTMLYEITPNDKKDTFERTGDLDFAYELPGLARFRANYFQQKHGHGAVFRRIPTKIVSAEALGLPPILCRAAMLHKGLVLVTGPTGSGKSTTLAAMIDLGFPVGARGEHGQTALHWAAWHGWRETAAALLSRGAALEATENEFGATPLARRSNSALVITVLQSAAAVLAEAPSVLAAPAFVAA